jgi:hypothetical protein
MTELQAVQAELAEIKAMLAEVLGRPLVSAATPPQAVLPGSYSARKAEAEAARIKSQQRRQRREKNQA